MTDIAVEHARIIRSDPRFVETIDWYTADGYKDFNVRMRNRSELTEEQERHLKILDAIFSLIPPLSEPIVTYKGIISDSYESDLSFMSTSRNIKSTYEFTGGNCCVVEITVSPGSKALFLQNMSTFVEEEEVLLDRNCKIWVTGRTMGHPKSKIFATYIPQYSIGIHDIEKAKEAVDIKLVAERIQSIISPDEFELYDRPEFEDEIRKYYLKITGEAPSNEIVDFIYGKFTE